ncbi:MAG: serine/threonine protein kinase bacterial [Chloroflexi bacterium]|nr:MAG: serine/threonine protein kinase bacterial [Chloroflexota bacterium]MBA4375923.1 serine/threonine protein kinase [Anaerolinea sp.]
MPIPLKTGDTLRGRYRIRRIIGQGGMGSIYLTDDLRLEGRQCALKEVEHDRTLSGNLIKEAREQFLREATVLARLDHPNLPKVSDFFSIGQRDYLVMDFIPGKDLRTLMIESKEEGSFLPESDVLNWSNQLADALTYLHHQNPPIVHRDIKPSNLKLTPNGVLKLVDFGLVKLLAPGEVTITILQGQGTALYTPLEQYGGDIGHTDARSDIYSFGSTLYHLLTGKAPSDARQRFINPAILSPLRPNNPSISSRTEKAILWAMSLHPDDRPKTVEDFRDALIGSRPIAIPTGIHNQAKLRLMHAREIYPLLISLLGMSILTLLLTLLK